MRTKQEDLEYSKRIYADFLKGRKRLKSEDRFEAGFDFGYETGLVAAWNMLHDNKDKFIKQNDKNSGFFRKYHASSSVSDLMYLISKYQNMHECYEKYRKIECFCEKCGRLK